MTNNSCQIDFSMQKVKKARSLRVVMYIIHEDVFEHINRFGKFCPSPGTCAEKHGVKPVRSRQSTQMLICNLKEQCKRCLAEFSDPEELQAEVKRREESRRQQLGKIFGGVIPQEELTYA